MLSTVAAPLQDASTGSDVNATPSQDIDVTALPAVITWRNPDGESQSLGGLTFDIHHNVHSSKAFFRLRTAVGIKSVTPRSRKTYVYLFVEPEHINSMILAETPDTHNNTERAWKSLGSDIVCIHFDMDNPPTLITPKTSLAPRSNAAGTTLDRLFKLVSQQQFTVYAKIPSRTLPASKLSLLCEVVSNRGLTSISAHANPAHLYGGHGGKVFDEGLILSSSDVDTDSKRVSGPASTTVTRDASHERLTESPPSYDEIPPGPPQQITRPLKRRRRSSSPPAIERVDRKYIEDICANIVEDRLATLKRDVAAQLENIKSELLDHIDDCVNELRADIREDTGALIEDEYYSVRAELKDHVDEQINDLEDRVLDTVSKARLTLDLNI